MPELAVSVRYVLLKGTDACMQGHIRFETSVSNTKLTLHAEGCRPGCPLRILLISCGEEHAVLDVGPIVPSENGVVRETRSLPPLKLRHWDAVVLAEDWPSAKLTAAGWLTGQSGARWRLQEAAARYLAVPPACGKPLQDVVGSQ